MDSLQFSEVSETELSVLDNFVEIETYAAGLNFKVSDRNSAVTFSSAARFAFCLSADSYNLAKCCKALSKRKETASMLRHNIRLERTYFLSFPYHQAFLTEIAVIMGIVPENQSLLGLEGAGVVRQVGKNASAYRVGQRVIISMRGCFANRVLCPTDCVYPLPDSMCFEVRRRFVYVFVFGTVDA